MVLIMLFVTTLLILMISLYIFKGDLVHPGVIVPLVFTASIVSAMYNITLWQLEISLVTYFVVVGSVLLFVLISYQFSTPNMDIDNSLSTTHIPFSEWKAINIPKVKTFIVLLFFILTGVLYVREVVEIGTRMGGSGSLTNIMYYYRQSTSYDLEGVEEGIPGIIGHMYDMTVAISYVYVYVIVNNIFVKGRKFSKSLLLPVIICCIITFLSAARIQLLYFAMSGIVFYFLLSYKKTNRDSINITKILKISFFLFIILAFFVYLRNFIGRGLSDLSSNDPIYYFTVYAGGPIALLDAFIENPPASSDIFGREMFFRLNRFIGTTFDIPELIYIQHREFRRTVTDYSLGNVYTAFRSYIYDFGYFGLIFFTSVTSAFYSSFYAYLKRKSYTPKVDISMLIYGYLVPGVFLMSISERLFSIYFSVNSIKMILFIVIANYFITRMRIVR